MIHSTESSPLTRYIVLTEDDLDVTFNETAQDYWDADRAPPDWLRQSDGKFSILGSANEVSDDPRIGHLSEPSNWASLPEDSAFRSPKRSHDASVIADADRSAAAARRPHVHGQGEQALAPLFFGSYEKQPRGTPVKKPFPPKKEYMGQEEITQEEQDGIDDFLESIDPWPAAKRTVLSDEMRAHAYAYHVMKKEYDLTTLTYDKIATRVLLPSGKHPLGSSVRRTCYEIEKNGGDWRTTQENRGRPPIYPEEVKKQIAKEAMKLKKDWNRAPDSRELRRCIPDLVANPTTKNLMSSGTILKILKEYAYDEDAKLPWKVSAPLKIQFVPPAQMQLRHDFCDMMTSDIRYRHINEQWAATNVVYCDPVSDLCPQNPNRLAGLKKGIPRGQMLMSPDRKGDPINLAGVAHKKQKHTGDIKPWYMCVMTQGRFTLDPLPEDFHNNAHHCSKWVKERLDDVVSDMHYDNTFTSTFPRHVYVDKGPAHSKQFRQAVRDAGFQMLIKEEDWRNDLVGFSPDLVPHETAMAWIKRLSDYHQDFCVRGFETLAQHQARWRTIQDHINLSYKLRSLCGCLRRRWELCKEMLGNRLRH